MSQYASKTQVPSDRSRAEIERILKRYGAESFGYGWEADQAVIVFRANERQVKFVLPLPEPNETEFVYTANNRPRSAASSEAVYEQAVRQRWRALALVIKAKLEAVETGIVDFEEEFLAHIMLPDGRTTGEWLRPQIVEAYETGDMPTILPGSRRQITA